MQSCIQQGPRETPARSSRLTGRVEGVEALLNEAQEEEDLGPASSRHLQISGPPERLGFLWQGLWNGGSSEKSNAIACI